MGEKDLRVSAAEIHRLSVECGACKSAIVFEATASRGPGETVCPNCGGSMPNVAALVGAFRTLFENAKGAKAPVHFLVHLDD
jgi:hypothetical protein